jgi:hypothetical protein
MVGRGVDFVRAWDVMCCDELRCVNVVLLLCCGDYVLSVRLSITRGGFDVGLFVC